MTATYPTAQQAPELATVYVHDWGQNCRGELTAHYTLWWQTPEGMKFYFSRRREPVESPDWVSSSALRRLERLFPGTRWNIAPPGIRRSPQGGLAVFKAQRA